MYKIVCMDQCFTGKDEFFAKTEKEAKEIEKSKKKLYSDVSVVKMEDK